MTWADVPQTISHHRTRGEARMRLGNGKGGDVLWVTLPNNKLRAAGLAEGDTLALSIGTGRNTGFLRLSKREGGRILKRLGRSKTCLTVMLVPPDAWCGFTCESTLVEAGAELGAITIAIPWDFSEAETGTGPAGHEVHS